MKKVTRRSFLKVVTSSAIASTAAILVGCVEKNEEPESGVVSESLVSESSSVDMEANSKAVTDYDNWGVWTLEECQEYGGLYYKTDDDLFIPYNGSNCVKDIGDDANTVLANISVYDRAIETPINTLYFFMWPEYKSDSFWIMGYKIVASGWMPMIVYPGDNEERLVTSVYVSESQKEIELFSRYGMTNCESLWVKTINGEQAYTSQDIVTIMDYGVGGTVEAFSDNMKGQLVTFGYVEGTTLTEQKCYMEEFFGIYSNKLEHSLKPTITATTDGYAILDYSGNLEKEEGLYILEIGVVEGNNKTVKRYRTLLNLKH